jgi:tripartite-type tricarboxylate transporter receptor subunit TctC
MIHRPRLAIAAAILFLTLPALAPRAFAQSDYPNRPIGLVVAFPPGGVTDVVARQFAASLSDVLKQPVVVMNRAGAGGRIGAEEVARAKPDGYTLLFANTPTNGTLAASTLPLRYDPLKSFASIAPLFWYGPALVCNPAIPARSVAELIAFARRQPKGLTYGSAGVGSAVNFSAEWFGSLAGVKMTQVPYRGSAPALQAVMAGEVDCTFDGAAHAQVEAGAVRGFATTGLKRDPFYARLPTLDESGLKGFDMVLWQGLAGPAGLPAATVARLNAASMKALQAPELVAALKRYGVSELGGPPDELARLVEADVAKYRRLASEHHIVFE